MKIENADYLQFYFLFSVGVTYAEKNAESGQGKNENEVEKTM